MVKMVHDYPQGIVMNLTLENSIRCKRKTNQKEFLEYKYKMTIFIYFYKLFRVLFNFFLCSSCYLDGFRGFKNRINLYFLIRHLIWNFLFATNIYISSSCAVVMFQFLNCMIYYLVMCYKQFNIRLADFVQKGSSTYSLCFAITI